MSVHCWTTPTSGFALWVVAWATASTTTAQPVAQTTTQSANPDVGVVQQWTDMNGYTGRTMDDGSTLWWTGSTWEKYA